MTHASNKLETMFSLSRGTLREWIASDFSAAEVEEHWSQNNLCICLCNNIALYSWVLQTALGYFSAVAGGHMYHK